MANAILIVFLIGAVLQGTSSFECRNCCGSDYYIPNNAFEDSEGAKITACTTSSACKSKDLVKCGPSATFCYIREGSFTAPNGQTYPIYINLCQKSNLVGLTCDGSDTHEIPTGTGYKLVPTRYSGNPAWAWTPYTRCDYNMGTTTPIPTAISGGTNMAATSGPLLLFWMLLSLMMMMSISVTY